MYSLEEKRKVVYKSISKQPTQGKARIRAQKLFRSHKTRPPIDKFGLLRHSPPKLDTNSAASTAQSATSLAAVSRARIDALPYVYSPRPAQQMINSQLSYS